MRYQYWMGTEDSLLDLQKVEAEVSDLRKAAAANGNRQAFMFFDDEDESDDRRIGAHLIEVVGGIGAIKVSGSLVNSHQFWHQYMSGRVTSYEAIAGALKILAEDASVEEILLQIASGGGQVTGLDALAQKIRRVDANKPVRAHTETSAFSAAYWIGSSAREFTASRMAEVGSIGTLMVHQSLARMADKEGIDITVFRAGKYKAAGHPMEALSEEHREYLQKDVETANMFFLEHVAKRRNLAISEKGTWAEGLTFFAGDAQRVGLVDRIVNLEDLFSKSASGAAYQRRSSEMKISQEKLAQIEAGANPEDVLSESELKEYNAAIDGVAKNASAEEGVGEGVAIAQAKLDRITAGEAPEDVLEASELEKFRADNPESPGKDAEESSPGKAYSDLLKEFGRLEARLEVRDEKITELEARLASRDKTFESLMAIGVDALQKRQVALGKAVTEPGTPEALINSYHDVSAEMAKRFRVGKQSIDQKTEDDESADSVPRSLQVRKQGY